jgi:hypothetical protein
MEEKNLQFKNLELANHYARLSCPKWNRAEDVVEDKILGWMYRHSRRKNRKKYQAMIIPGEGTNTYPWPFSDPNFANWEEDDSSENYSLVSDPSGCVIKYATSYCAWKIYETTGRWPQRKTHVRMDAKNWRFFLKEAGYGEIVAHPSIGGKFVGINPRIGEYGFVVWYEGESKDMGEVVVSSYKNKEFFFGTVNFAEYDWIKIA